MPPRDRDRPGPLALDAWLHALEDAHGRDRSGPRFGDRTLDIDLVLFDDLVLRGPRHLQVRARTCAMPSCSAAGDLVPRLRRTALRPTLAALWAASPERDVAMAVVEPGFT
jgi:2-amino-4-hydroxy-6-hydroxymethyldihydropteridine diphosphokinase